MMPQSFEGLYPGPFNYIPFTFKKSFCNNSIFPLSCLLIKRKSNLGGNQVAPLSIFDL